MQTAFFALGNLVFVGDFESVIIRLNGISTALQVIRKHFDHEGILTEAIFFLKNMAFSETGCETIVANSAIQLISELLMTHQKKTDLIRMLYKLVSDLTYTAHLDDLVQSCGSQILHILRTDPQLTKPTLKLLSQFYLPSSRESKLFLLRDNLIPTLLHLPPHTPQLQNLLNTISTTPLTYSKTPTCPPSLLEISARKFINSTPAQSHLLCLDLQNYVSRSKRCDCCQQFFFRK